MHQTRSPEPHFARQASAALLAEPRLFRREFVLVMLVQSLFGISFSSFLILPKFLKLELHASAQEIGWMAATSLGSAAFFSPLVGAAISRFDRRLILAVALVVEAGSAFAFLAVERVGPLALALRAAQGLAFVTVFTGNAALVADSTPNHQLSRALGYMGAAMLVTNALAPLMAEPVATHFGWKYVFICAGIVSSLTLFVIAKLGSASPNLLSSETPSISRPTVLGTLPIHFGSLLMGAGVGVMFTYVQPFALDQGAQNVSQLFVGYALAATFVRIALGGFSDRVGPARMAAAAMLLYALTVLATAGMTPSTLLYLGASLGVAHGFLYPALTAAGLQVLGRPSRGQFLGWFSFFFNLGYALSVLLLGPIADRAGYPPIFVATGLCLALGVLPLVRFGQPHIESRS